MYDVQQLVNFTFIRPINRIKLILSYVMTEINKLSLRISRTIFLRVRIFCSKVVVVLIFKKEMSNIQ